MGIFNTASGSETLHYSAPVTVTSVEFDATSRTILAYCGDGYTRRCRIEHCSSLGYARALFKLVKVYAELGGELVFTAMGNNTPDRWFCDANDPLHELRKAQAKKVEEDNAMAEYMQS